jgi:hypothetical protein
MSIRNKKKLNPVTMLKSLPNELVACVSSFLTEEERNNLIILSKFFYRKKGAILSQNRLKLSLFYKNTTIRSLCVGEAWDRRSKVKEELLPTLKNTGPTVFFNVRVESYEDFCYYLMSRATRKVSPVESYSLEMRNVGLSVAFKNRDMVVISSYPCLSIYMAVERDDSEVFLCLNRKWEISISAWRTEAEKKRAKKILRLIESKGNTDPSV